MKQQTPVHLAFKEGHEAVGWVLVEAGGYLHTPDMHEMTAWEYYQNILNGDHTARSKVDSSDTLGAVTSLSDDSAASRSVRFEEARAEKGDNPLTSGDETDVVGGVDHLEVMVTEGNVELDLLDGEERGDTQGDDDRKSQGRGVSPTRDGGAGDAGVQSGKLPESRVNQGGTGKYSEDSSGVSKLKGSDCVDSSKSKTVVPHVVKENDDRFDNTGNIDDDENDDNDNDDAASVRSSCNDNNSPATGSKPQTGRPKSVKTRSRPQTHNRPQGHGSAPGRAQSQGQGQGHVYVHHPDAPPKQRRNNKPAKLTGKKLSHEDPSAGDGTQNGGQVSTTQKPHGEHGGQGCKCNKCKRKANKGKHS